MINTLESELSTQTCLILMGTTCFDQMFISSWFEDELLKQVQTWVNIAHHRLILYWAEKLIYYWSWEITSCTDQIWTYVCEMTKLLLEHVSVFEFPLHLGFVWIQGCLGDDGSHNSTPFGSMHACGWVWKERSIWVKCLSAQRWRESCTVEWECQVIPSKLQRPCALRMHATWSHEIPDLAQEPFDSMWNCERRVNAVGEWVR